MAEKHPGLAKDIAKILKAHPTQVYGPQDLSAHFPHVKVATLQYHLQEGVKRGEFTVKSRGRYMTNAAFRDVKETQAQIAAMKPRVVDSGRPFQTSTQPIMAVDTRWASLLRQYGRSLTARMKAVNKTGNNEIFTEEDFSFVNDLIVTATVDVDKLGKDASNVA